MPLKLHRLVLLLPGLLLGVLPIVHGFCTDSKAIYLFGLLSLTVALGDFMLCYKLRAFHEDDLVAGSDKPYSVTIIRRNYGRKN